MKSLGIQLWRREPGVALVEYGLLVTLIALASIASVDHVAIQIVHMFLHAASSLGPIAAAP